MLRLDIIGAGSIGSALIYLLKDYFGAACQIRIFDCSVEALNDIDDALVISKLQNYALFENPDFVISCSSWQTTIDTLLYLLKADFAGYFLSISRDVSGETLYLKSLLDASQIKVLMPLGLEPGLLEIFIEYQLNKYGELDKLISYCGGIVCEKPQNPLGYKRLFGKTHLPFTAQDVYKLNKGKVVTLPRFSEVSSYHWEDIGELESFHDGLTNVDVLNEKLKHATIEQRTLRWPGYAEGVTLLNKLGLLQENRKNIIEQWLEPLFRLSPNDNTKTLLAIHSWRDGKEHAFKVMFPDYSSKVNSMALATCLPILYLLCRFKNLPFSKGTNKLEDLFAYDVIEDLLKFSEEFKIHISR